MCGILAVFRSKLTDDELRKQVLICSKRMRHRGPDWSGFHVKNGTGLAHERLAIIDRVSGAQPLTNAEKTIYLTANGEIYNYKDLYASLEKPYTPLTGSDCEVIIPLYQQVGIDAFPNMLRGMFSFVLYDEKDDSFIAVRDHMGITPLYMGSDEDGSVWFASEMKGLSSECTSITTFPPGHAYSSKTGAMTRWYNPVWRGVSPEPSTHPFDPVALRTSFEVAVRRRMMSDVPWGVLLSGGLDSSLVAAVVMRMMKSDQADALRLSGSADPVSPPLAPPVLHSFCVGLEGSPDLVAAQRVADYLGTNHHSYTFSVQEGLDAIRDVVHHLETFDTTTVRASIPMYLMSRKIKATGIKMVLSGEGSDEVFGGYLYFHKAPNAEEFQAELRDKLDTLHLFDCLRANKSTSSWGLEARVPFLDRDFLDLAMTIDPEEKMIRTTEEVQQTEKGKDYGVRIEKHILRKAFDEPAGGAEKPLLPADILWRQKEQFSDGVGYHWIDSLKVAAEKHVTDEQLSSASTRYPYNTPTTKEGYWYRSIFEEFFPSDAALKTVPLQGNSIACSTARAIGWHESFAGRADCSGRAVAGVHDQAYIA